MNPDQLIKAELIALATISGKELNEIALRAYSEALSDLPAQDVLAALKQWLRTGKGFPYPADIREKIMPEINPQDDAEDIANTVITSVTRHGYTNPQLAEAAIGELGWVVVTRMGGWKHLCETLTPQNESTFRAQIRNYAETVRRKAVRGELDVKAALPARREAHPNEINFSQMRKLIETQAEQIRAEDERMKRPEEK